MCHGREAHMQLEEIKMAVDQGKTVHWVNEGYTVVAAGGDYLIGWMAGTGHRAENYIGLTHRDGVTLNGRPAEFFLAQAA